MDMYIDQIELSISNNFVWGIWVSQMDSVRKEIFCPF